MDLRRFARSHLPAGVLRRRKVLARRIDDWRRRTPFVSQRTAVLQNFPYEWSRYARPIIDYPGQEALGRAKRKNQAVLASFLHGTVIQPGEVFSIWHLAPQPGVRHGYEPAAVVRDGTLGSETGGAICLLSTVLYNVALLAGMDIVERHCHSLDYYNGRPYFELGRDAAIEYGYLDLRFGNPHEVPLALSISVDEGEVAAALIAPCAREFTVGLDISGPEALPPLPGDSGRYRVRTFRITTSLAGTRREDLGWSTHRVPVPGRTGLGHAS